VCKARPKANVTGTMLYEFSVPTKADIGKSRRVYLRSRG
jgi:hypothetical protein